MAARIGSARSDYGPHHVHFSGVWIQPVTQDSFASRLAALDEITEEAWGAHTRRMNDRLSTTGALENRPEPGSLAPSFALPSAEGQLVTLEDLLRRSGHGLILTFVRGGWCPYCRAQMQAFAEALPAYRKMGFALAIVTPEVGGRSAHVKDELGLKTDVLCDVDQGTALTYGCLFPVANDYREDMVEAGYDLAQLYGNEAWFLPLPGSFLIGPDGRIRAVFGGIEQRRRDDPVEILAQAVMLMDREAQAASESRV